MNAINTTLTTSGNSVAVRLPKELLAMSGLTDRVRLEAREGQIIITGASNPRQGWDEQISSLVAMQGDPAAEFQDMDTTANDGLDSLAWEGPTLEQWQASNARIS
jgi:antitoxin component of MazEF toxin-antitoxin module